MHTTRTTTTKPFPIRKDQLHGSYDAIDFSLIVVSAMIDSDQLPLSPSRWFDL